MWDLISINKPIFFLSPLAQPLPFFTFAISTAILFTAFFLIPTIDSMVTSMEGLGTDCVFSLHEDTHYRISKSLLKPAEGSTVPLTRVKCLVSMTTPHDIRLHGSSVMPAFIEFDTSLEGFGYGLPKPFILIYCSSWMFVGCFGFTTIKCDVEGCF